MPLRVLILAAAGCALLAAAPAAAAACDRRADAAYADAARIVTALQAAGAPGSADAAAVLARSRASCSDARFAQAVARATQREGAPTVGRRLRINGIDLRAMQAGTEVAWRFDAVAQARRLAGASRASAAARLRADLRAAGTGRAGISWSEDATRPGFDPDRQAAVAAALGRSSRPADRRLAGASARAFASAPRRAALAGRPLLLQLRAATRIAFAARRSGSAAAADASRRVAVRIHARVRASRAAGWSRLGGTWSTGAQHRTLVRQARVLLRSHPHETTAAAVGELELMLRARPTVAFGQVPREEFYPWPRDGAFDSQVLVVQVDKPGTATLLVYDAAGALVQSVPHQVVPGAASLAWDGTSRDGTTMPAGRYRYNVDVVDPVGNRRRVAGLATFRVARDAVAPSIRTATVRHVESGGSRRLVATWDVEEVHSPQVRTWLLLRNGPHRARIQLHATRQRATVRRPVALRRGTWSATFSFRDGSGNAARRPAGTFRVR